MIARAKKWGNSLGLIVPADVVRGQNIRDGVIVAAYARAGDVETGSFEFDDPAQAELARRARLRKEG